MKWSAMVTCLLDPTQWLVHVFGQYANQFLRTSMSSRLVNFWRLCLNEWLIILSSVRLGVSGSHSFSLYGTGTLVVHVVTLYNKSYCRWHMCPSNMLLWFVSQSICISVCASHFYCVNTLKILITSWSNLTDMLTNIPIYLFWGSMVKVRMDRCRNNLENVRYFKSRILTLSYLYTHRNEVRGVYWNHPVRLSVCLSVRL